MEEYDLNSIKIKLTELINDGISYNKWLVQASIHLKFINLPRVKERYTAEDIVHSIIEKLYTGKRKWDYNKYPELFYHVIYLIRSIVNNLIRYEEKFIDLVSYDEIEGGLEDIVPAANEINEPEADLLYSKICEAELLKICDDKLKDDEDALLVFYELIENKGKNSHKMIAESLGVDVQFVQNAYKRIKRKLIKVLFNYCELPDNNGKKRKVKSIIIS